FRGPQRERRPYEPSPVHHTAYAEHAGYQGNRREAPGRGRHRPTPSSTATMARTHAACTRISTASRGFAFFKSSAEKPSVKGRTLRSMLTLKVFGLYAILLFVITLGVCARLIDLRARARTRRRSFATTLAPAGSTRRARARPRVRPGRA